MKRVSQAAQTGNPAKWQPRMDASTRVGGMTDKKVAKRGSKR